jgi:hypothetical protein
MKVQVSLKGRGNKLNRKGRMAQGYFCRRNGIRYFYPFDNTSIGPRIKSRQPIPKKKKRRMKY